jgi:RimJ/RimL family protein N-acetyltransferase
LLYKQLPGKPIGSCGLHNIDHRNQVATAGLAIGEKDYWKRGYGAEACLLLIKYGFEELNLNRISSAAYAENIGSIRMQKKVGFRQEGRGRELRFSEGKFHDEIFFGMLRREYIKLYKKSAN